MGQGLGIGADRLPPILSPVTSSSFLVSEQGDGNHDLIHQLFLGSRVILLTRMQGLQAPLYRGHLAFSIAPVMPPIVPVARREWDSVPTHDHIARIVQARKIAQRPGLQERQSIYSPQLGFLLTWPSGHHLTS